MSGFDNEVLFAKNVDFRGVQPVVAQMTINGQLLIGSSVEPFIRAAVPTSSNGSVTITAGPGTLDFVATTAVANYVTNSGAATPSGGNLLIVGGPGITTSASSNAITVNNLIFTDRGTSTAVLTNTGSFSTAAITLTLPATVSNGDMVSFVASTANVLVLQLPGAQVANVGNVATSAGGTITSTAKGDSLTLRYQTSSNDWFAVSSMGIWVLA